MRRMLVLAMLLLMIMTSLNAGTLAIYISRVDLVAVPIVAKRFVLGVNQGSSNEFDLQIAPGDIVTYQFIVSNSDSEGRVSEVNMNLHVEADFSAVIGSLPGIRIQLMRQDAGVYELVAESDSSGRLSLTHINAFIASEAMERHYSLVFIWADSVEARAVVMTGRMILPLAMYVRGSQNVQ